MTQKDTMKRLIMTGDMRSVMWRLSIPGIVGMVLFGINQLIDAMFVGNLVGPAALGGVSLSLPLAQMGLGLGAMLGGGAGAMLSIALGSNDRTTQQRIIGNMNALALVCAVLFVAVGVPHSEGLVRLMGGSGELLRHGTSYLRIVLIGSVFTIWGLGGNFVIRAEGKMKEAMIFAGTAVVGNIVLNAVFMGAFGWGVAGAAWATNAGMAIYCVTNIVYFSSPHVSFPARPVSLHLDRAIMKKIVTLGFPALITQTMTLVQQLVVFRLLAQYGSAADITFFGAVMRIVFVASLPAAGMTRALQPVVGINFGAGNIDRVRAALMRFTGGMVLILGMIGVAVILFPATVMGSLLPDTAFSADDLLRARMLAATLPIIPGAFVALTYFPGDRERYRGQCGRLGSSGRRVCPLGPCCGPCVARFWGVLRTGGNRRDHDRFCGSVDRRRCSSPRPTGVRARVGVKKGACCDQ